MLVTSRLYIILLLSALAGSPAFAQPDTSYHKQLSIRLSPCALIDINDGPSLRAGLEYKLTDRIALFIDGKEYLHFSSNSKWLAKTSVVGHAVIPGIKWFITRHPEISDIKARYFQFWYAYKDQAYTFTDSIAVNSSHVFRPFRMHQYSNSFSISYGEQTPIGKTHLLLDWYTGVGIRVFNSSSDLGGGEQAYDYHDWTGDLTFYPNTATGHRVYPSLLLGLIIAYRF